jgi:hypothetical protein
MEGTNNSMEMAPPSSIESNELLRSQLHNSREDGINLIGFTHEATKMLPGLFLLNWSTVEDVAVPPFYTIELLSTTSISG